MNLTNGDRYSHTNGLSNPHPRPQQEARDDDTNEDGIDFDAADDFSDGEGSDTEDEFASRETRWVVWLRSTVLTVWVTSALLVSAVIYQSIRSAQINQLQEQFKDACLLLERSWQTSMQAKLSSLEAFAVELELFAVADSTLRERTSSSSAWPLVTLPDFEMRAAMTRASSQADWIAVLPRVEASKAARHAWEEYSVEHYQEWLPIPSPLSGAVNNLELPGEIGSNLIRRGRQLTESFAADHEHISTAASKSNHSPTTSISPHIFNQYGSVDDNNNSDVQFYLPLWQTSPSTLTNLSQYVNYDFWTGSAMPDRQLLHNDIKVVLETGRVVLGNPLNVTAHPILPSTIDISSSSATPPLVSPLLFPIWNKLSDNALEKNVSALIVAMIPWTSYFSNILPPSTSVSAVVTTERWSSASWEPATVFTLEITAGSAVFTGLGDLHAANNRLPAASVNLILNTTAMLSSSLPLRQQNSLHVPSNRFTLQIYATQHMYNHYVTAKPFFYTALVALVFVLACMVFVFYDKFVEERQQVVMSQAVQSNAIVSSLFPERFRDRLFRRASLSEVQDDGSLTFDEAPSANLQPLLSNTNGFYQMHKSQLQNNCSSSSNNSNRNDSSFMMVQPAKMRLKTFLTDDEDGVNGSVVSSHAVSGPSKPLADLFPRCTVLFADISGFTAWSSLRDPAQVFTLLESVYQAFDRIARRRGVFKVETIGDSYVAVTGLPEPQDDHAVIMALFARDCRRRMTEVTRKLELTLGPDTGDLRMRFGLHSGPVTAGVLRGEKSRFQLFGDTVNTSARMESTGERDRIQVSQATADLIRDAGKAHWLVKRDKTVHAKGKGEMQTYWCEIQSRRHSTGENSRCSISSVNSGDTLPSDSFTQANEKSALWGVEEEIPEVRTQKTKHQRLIDYNVDLLAQRLKQVIARRKSLAMRGRRCSQGGLPPNWEVHCANKVHHGTVLDEVSEIIKLPQFNAKEFKEYIDPDSIELDLNIMSQLKRYVTVIAAMYRSNPFHNFEHASHVTMSVNKLLQRVVTPDIAIRRSSLQMGGSKLQKQIASDLHNYTFGITSDPLTQFAIVFAALIHDVDHWGVSNMQLVQEGVSIAEKYKNKSVAEQNSVDLAWDLLMDEEEYGMLHQCIFPTDAEFKRFRQVVVNVVMATDIFDKELGELRKNRWAKAFSEQPSDAQPDPDAEHRKATIVIEHIMQASDVAHTMQHWHVYQKWNRRLFDELYTAYKAGRMERDPSTFWYESEIKFFDGYVIPLAKKLQECSVFGVASDECLNYALDNRKEWESKGQMIINELVGNYEQRESEEAENAAPTKKKSRFSRRRSLITTGG